MTWNYRLMRHRGPGDEITLAVHEVYYDESGVPNGWTEKPVSFGGHTPEDVIESLRRAIEGCGKPILEYSPDEKQDG